MSTRKKRVILILVAVVIAAAAIAIVVYQKQYAKTADPSELKGLWSTKEMWQGDELINEGPSATLIAIDEKGGYRFWDEGVDHVGMLSEKNGRLHFKGADGASYSLYGQGGELILLRELGDDQQQWIFSRDGDYGDTQMSDQEKLNQLYAIQKKGMDMEDETCGWLYRSIMTSMLGGTSQEDAIEAAKEGYIEDGAFDWYAEEHHIVITDKEFKAYMDSQIPKDKDIGGLKEIEKALQKAGMTMEEYVWRNEATHRVNCIKSNLYEEHEKGWEAFKKDVVDQFKDTKAYDRLKVEMDKAVEKIKTELVQPA